MPLKERYPKIECNEMYNSVRKHLGVTELRQKHYTLYNYWTAKKSNYLSSRMYNRLLELYDNITPSTKVEVPYDATVKSEWLKTLEIHKESEEFKMLSDVRKEKIKLEFYRLKEMIN